MYPSAKDRRGVYRKEGGRGGDTEQGKLAGCEKRSSSWSLFRKGPHSPAGSCSALVLLVQCWWSGCPPPSQGPPPHVPPNCPLCWSYADSLDPRPRHMEARPKGLLSNVLHSWDSAGESRAPSCNHMLSASSSPQKLNFLIGRDQLDIRGIISVHLTDILKRAFDFLIEFCSAPADTFGLEISASEVPAEVSKDTKSSVCFSIKYNIVHRQLERKNHMEIYKTALVTLKYLIFESDTLTLGTLAVHLLVRTPQHLLFETGWRMSHQSQKKCQIIYLPRTLINCGECFSFWPILDPSVPTWTNVDSRQEYVAILMLMAALTTYLTT